LTWAPKKEEEEEKNVAAVVDRPSLEEGR